MKTETRPQTIELGGESYVIIPERQYRTLVKASEETILEAPQPLPNGNYDALSVLRFELARKIIAAREAAGWSQAELARQAKMRVETLNRIEKAKVMADEATVIKISKALKKAGQKV